METLQRFGKRHWRGVMAVVFSYVLRALGVGRTN